MNLAKQVLYLSTGETVLSEYHPDGDLLEIIFRPGEATAAVELTESIILRFDWATDEPLSLGFISFSQLARPAEFGEVYFELLTAEWPDEVKTKVLMMLRRPPLTEFLALSSFAPAIRLKLSRWLPSNRLMGWLRRLNLPFD